MKRLLSLLFAFAAFMPVRAQILFSDDFNFPVGDLVGSGGWAIVDTNFSENVTVSAGNLVYDGYSQGVGNCAHIVSGPGKDDAYIFFSDNSAAIGNLYVAFLIRVNEWQPIVGVYPVCLMPGVGISGPQGIGDEDVCRLTVYCPAANTVQFGIQRSVGEDAFDSRGPQFSNDGHPVFLVVIKYDFDQEMVSLFVNPDLSGPEPTPDATNNTGKQFLDLQRIQLRQGDDNGDYDVNVDALRVFLRWEDSQPPIDLSSFSIERTSSSSITLHWTTPAETNNLGFNVQRCTPGEQLFTELQGAFIPGHGTTSEPQQYSYVDEFNAPEGTAYRLRQTDFDGSVHYSNQIFAGPTTGVAGSVSKTFTLYQNYPNPFNPETNITFSVDRIGPATLTLYDILGRKISVLFNDIAAPGKSYSFHVDGSALGSGSYFYELSSEGHRAVKRMLLLR